jgi:ribosomal protein S18 acetylase RimI-like enzyme
MAVRTLEDHETALHRDIRLRALKESPAAFGLTFEDESRQPLAYWEDQTQAVTDPARNAMFVAHDGDAQEMHGMIYALRARDVSDGGRIGGMWVSPAHRRQGIGGALLECALIWAGENNLSQIGLWAPAAGGAAIALYRRAGFKETGIRNTMPGRPALEIVEMIYRG